MPPNVMPLKKKILDHRIINYIRLNHKAQAQPIRRIALTITIKHSFEWPIYKKKTYSSIRKKIKYAFQKHQKHLCSMHFEKT